MNIRDFLSANDPSAFLERDLIRASTAVTPRTHDADAARGADVTQGQEAIWQRLLRLVADPEALTYLDAAEAVVTGEDGITHRTLHPMRVRAEADIALVEALEGAGVLSTCQVAAMPERTFVAAFADTDGVETDRLRAVHRRAVRRRNGIHNLVETVRGRIASPFARALRSDNLPLETEALFTDIPSYQEMFGGLNYCHCEACSSVFGPAAYFLDVMGIIDDYITLPNVIPSGYSLRERRPDLFALKLSCANTNDPVPLLRIAADVLAARITSITHSTSAYQDVAIAAYPTNLPFSLPLAELREYFVAAGSTLAACYDAFLVPGPAASLLTPAQLASETLGLSPDLTALLTTPDPEPASLAARYGFRNASDLSQLQRVALFTDRAALSYAELADLLTQQLSDAEVAAGAADSFFINATGENLPPLAIAVDDSNPQAPFEKLINVSNQRYDRLDRFIRLWRRFDGSFGALDWAMKAAQANEITPAFLTNLATVAELRTATHGGWDELAALQHPLKTIGKGTGRAPADLFDRVYNNPRLLDGRDPYASETPFDPAKSYEWTIADTSGANGQLLGRIAAALGLSNADAARLGDYVAALQGFPSGAGKLVLDLATLSELYRLALSARLLRLDFASFCLVAGLTFYPGTDPTRPPAGALPPTLATFAALRRTITGVRAAPFTLYQLQYIYTGVAGPFVSIGYQPGQIGRFINDLAETSAGLRVSPPDLVFETIDEAAARDLFDHLVAAEFLTILGISLPKTLSFDALSLLFPLNPLSFAIENGVIDPDQSRSAFAQLLTADILLAVGPAGVLSSSYTPETALDFLFDGVPDAVAMRQQVREILNQIAANIRNTLETLERARGIQMSAANAGLAEFLDTTPEMIDLLLSFATGAADVRTYLADLTTPIGNDPPPQTVVTMMALLARANMLFVTLRYSAVEVNAVVTSPAHFDITDTVSLTLDGIWSLVSFKGLVEAFPDVNDELVRCYFGIRPTGSCPYGTDIAALANLTGWPAAEILFLNGLFWPAPVTDPPGWQTVAGLLILSRVFALSKTTALDVAGLAAIAGLAGTRLNSGAGIDAAAWSALTAAAAAMKAALAARYGSEAFDALDVDIAGRLLTRQRDALNGYALWVMGGVPELAAITSIPQLSQYLLIDLEMCGCDTTSYIAQGIASLQTYMQNARMNLEPGITKITVPDSWWIWLSAYRMWEANRKIYLYPENYVDPELLQGASPIYYDVKDEILQNEIDDQHVTQAYTSYFNSLAEQASLYPVSTYLSATTDARTGEETETHYFFGRTSIEPYTYFHRERSASGIWTPWKKIDLAINAAAISAAHAYGRLMIFWAEEASESGAAIKDANAEPQSTVHSTLRYSFVDSAGTWIQPQTLVADHVVAVHPNSYLASFQPVTAAAYLQRQYDETVIWWQVPHVYKLDRGLTGAGRITVTAGFNLAAGTNTLFEQQIHVGDRIRCAAQERTVTAIIPGSGPFKGAGAVTVTSGFDLVAGNPQSQFETQVAVGDQITVAGETRTVRAVISKQLVVNSNWTVGANNADYTITPKTVNPPQLAFDQTWTLGVRNAKYLVIPKDATRDRFPPFAGAGKITFTQGLNLVSGNAETRFVPQISAGDQISAMGETRVVILVQAATSPPQLVLDLAWGTSGSNVDYTIIPGGTGAERLLVTYGSPIDSALAPAPGPAPTPIPNLGRDNYLSNLNTFNQGLYATLILADRAKSLPPPSGTGTLVGQVTGGYAMQLSEALEGSEARVLSMNWQYSGVLPDDLQPYKPVVDRNNGILRVATSDNCFSDNYWAAAAPVPSQSFASSASGTPILYNIPSSASWLVPVSNQVGAFVFGLGTESYLATSTEAGLLRLSQISFTEAYPTSTGTLNEQLVSAAAYTAQPIPFSQIKFQFRRLGTTVVNRLSRRLLGLGLDGLISLDSQYLPELPFNRFFNKTDGQPGPALDTAQLPPDLMDFNGAYGLYFWEVFFYNVFLIADRLRSNRRFDAAKQWYEKIFNPTQPPAEGESAKDRWWRFRPFRGLTPETLIEILTDAAQIAVYENDPFDPHAIARLRPGAYPKAIVMRYVANLIDWGDMLFVQDTRESITQATQLYMLANELLGPRPIALGACPATAPKSYDEIKAAYDTSGSVAGATADTVTLASTASGTDHFYNGLTIIITAGPAIGQMRTIADYVGETRTARLVHRWSDPIPTSASTYAISGIPPFYIDLENGSTDLAGVQLSDVPFNDLSTYFSVPENADLMAYWDRIEDRLFKIRHCMNIDGKERALALFAPPIDPAALVRAAAAGALPPIGGVLAEPAVPFYRFEVMIEKARAAAAGVSQLGAALLSALEKQDAEDLALIHTSQEAGLLRLTTQLRQQQIEEVVATGAGLQQAYDSAKVRDDYYTALLDTGLSPGEIQSLDAMADAFAFNILASITKTASSIGFALPQVGSPFAMTYGGEQIGAVLQAAGDVFEIGSAIATYVSQRSLTTAGYDRRAEEWRLQQRLAESDMAQVQSQIDANTIRQQIAERELAIHQQQIINTAAIDTFLKGKFTNKALYQWMAGQLSRLYFQSYTLAFDLARSAQRAYQYELGSDKTFLAYGYWDSLKKGLTAGEALTQALDRLDAAYLNGNGRTYEIVRTIALSQLDPIALMRLKDGGSCEFALTEKLFDQDYPGHYMRQIASLSISIPAVIGPYQNFHATLTQLNDAIVLKPDPEAVAFLMAENTTQLQPQSLRTRWWPNQQIAISNGVNDAGVFELSFADRRFLPFEKTGAVSSWRLAIPQQTNHFDFATITDIILTLRYTALDGGAAFRRKVTDLPGMSAYAGAVFLPLRQFYPDAWQQFMTVHPDPAAQTLSFDVPPSVIPRHLSSVELTSLFLQLYLADGSTVGAGSQFITVKASDMPGGSAPVTLNARANGTFLFPTPLDFADVTATPRKIIFDLGAVPSALKTDGFLDPTKIIGIGLVLDYQGSITWN